MSIPTVKDKLIIILEKHVALLLKVNLCIITYDAVIPYTKLKCMYMYFINTNKNTNATVFTTKTQIQYLNA